MAITIKWSDDTSGTYTDGSNLAWSSLPGTAQNFYHLHTSTGSSGGRHNCTVTVTPTKVNASITIEVSFGAYVGGSATVEITSVLIT